MLVQPGMRPEAAPLGSTPAEVPAVRHAPLKKYQLFVVLAPVKSSLTPACASTVNGAPKASAANTVMKLLRLITDHLGSRRPDRKSTRLNSSHGYISYAVFCLKKKSHSFLKKLTCSFSRIFLLSSIHLIFARIFCLLACISQKQFNSFDFFSFLQILKEMIINSHLACKEIMTKHQKHHFFFLKKPAPPELSPLPLLHSFPI